MHHPSCRGTQKHPTLQGLNRVTTKEKAKQNCTFAEFEVEAKSQKNATHRDPRIGKYEDNHKTPFLALLAV